MVALIQAQNHGSEEPSIRLAAKVGAREAILHRDHPAILDRTVAEWRTPRAQSSLKFFRGWRLYWPNVGCAPTIRGGGRVRFLDLTYLSTLLVKGMVCQLSNTGTQSKVQ